VPDALPSATLHRFPAQQSPSNVQLAPAAAHVPLDKQT
jgi:hypothetical protein